MKKTEVKRDFKVLAEKISPENVLVMSEPLAIKETKTLTCFMRSFAEKAHEKLCCDVFLKDLRGYAPSDCYDMVQSVAVFLCEHFGEDLDDSLYISNREKRTHQLSWWFFIILPEPPDYLGVFFIQKAHRSGALLCLVCRHAVFDVGVLGIDIQPVEEIFAHEIRIALRMRFGQALVLIEIDRADVCVTCAVLFMIGDHMSIQTKRRGARRKP